MEQPKYPYVTLGEYPLLVLSPTEAVTVTKIQRIFVSEPGTVSIIMDSGKSYRTEGMTFSQAIKILSNPFEQGEEISKETKKSSLIASPREVTPVEEIQEKGQMYPGQEEAYLPTKVTVDELFDILEEWDDPKPDEEEDKHEPVHTRDSEQARNTGTPSEQDSTGQ